MVGKKAASGKIHEDETIDIVGLTKFAQGKEISLVLNHAEGTADSILLNHTYNGQQIQWFAEGVALNILRKEFSKS